MGGLVGSSGLLESLSLEGFVGGGLLAAVLDPGLGGGGGGGESSAADVGPPSIEILED